MYFFSFSLVFIFSFYRFLIRINASALFFAIINLFSNELPVSLVIVPFEFGTNIEIKFELCNCIRDITR